MRPTLPAACPEIDRQPWGHAWCVRLGQPGSWRAALEATRQFAGFVWLW